MKNLVLPLAMAAAGAGLLPAAAQAQFAKTEDAVRYRQGAWLVLNHHFTRIGLMVRGRMPFDPKLAVQDAEAVALLARLPAAAFGPGTDSPSDHARPEVWSEAARFREHNERLLAESSRLLAAARTQDLAQIKAAFGPAANTCKECHDAYRSQ
jgi:cytochrome c556